VTGEALTGGAVTLDLSGAAATLTLRRADSGNRLGREMAAALCEAAERLAAAPGLRALHLRAEGLNFCVGGALDEFGTDEPLSRRLARDLPAIHGAVATLAALPFPVVTELRGAVAGGGIGLALLGDIILASDTTFFRAGYPGVGLSPDLGGSWQMLRRSGVTFASEFLMSNRRMTAAEALTRGIVTAVHPDAALSQAARACVEMLATGPTRAHAALKALIAAPGADLAAHMAREAEVMAACAATEDSMAAIDAFRARRSPHFAGR